MTALKMITGDVYYISDERFEQLKQGVMGAKLLTLGGLHKKIHGELTPCDDYINLIYIVCTWSE